MQKYKNVIKEEKDLSSLVGSESSFDIENALRMVITYYNKWKGNNGQLIFLDNIAINDEKITKHLKVNITQDRTSPLISIGINNFSNESGYFMLWELSLSNNDSDRKIIPIFVNKEYILRPIAGKRIMDVFLDPNSKLTVKSVPNISQEEYNKLEKLSMEFAYDVFTELKVKHLKRNQERYDKYMYALGLRMDAAKHIGIENIKQSRLKRLVTEKQSIERSYSNNKKIIPEFKLINLTLLEASINHV